MDEMISGAALPRRNFYGRRHGKALRPTQQRHLDELLPRIAVQGVDRVQNPAREAIDLSALFGRVCSVWLEIGFGGGEHFAAQAQAHPEVGLIGCEPFINGVAMALNQITLRGVEGTVRLHPGDARDLLDVLPRASVQRVFLLYPDPWPKARHADRRFMSVDNLRALARVMAPGAELRLATDIPAYVEHGLLAAEQVPEFRVPAGPDWSAPWEEWHRTRYEAKAILAGRAPHYLRFVRRDDAAV